MSRLLAAAPLIALAAGLASCTSQPHGDSVGHRPAQTVQAPASDTRDLDQAVRRVVDAATPSVVRVFFGEGDMLTGTVISPDGLVLTCAHLPVAVGGLVTIGLSDGRKVPAKVLSKLPEEGEPRVGKDIALLKILESGPWPFAPVAAAAPVSSGEPMMALGFPDTLLFGSDRNTDPLYVRMGYETHDPYKGRPEELCTTIRGTGGDSGGPLFDMSGNIIGVVHGGDMSGAHMKYTRIEVLRQNWARLAPGMGEPPAPEPQPPVRTSVATLNEAASRVRGSIVEIHSGSRLVALGCVVGDGLILTKASELGPNLTIVTANDHVGIVEVAATDPERDLALLRLQYAPELTGGIEPIRWETARRPQAGTAVVTATSPLLSPQVAVTCAEAREVPIIPGYLPCEFEQGTDGIRVVRINDEMRRFRLRPIAQPLRVGDVLTRIERLPVPDLKSYKILMFEKCRLGDHPAVAGEPIRITFRRGDRVIEDVVGLEFANTPSGQLVRPASARYSGFASAIATDLLARPEHCGAPVLDSEGRVMGMLIARAPFVESLVLPSTEVAASLEKMTRAVQPGK